jgi:hypothetical protein
LPHGVVEIVFGQVVAGIAVAGIVLGLELLRNVGLEIGPNGTGAAVQTDHGMGTVLVDGQDGRDQEGSGDSGDGELHFFSFVCFREDGEFDFYFCKCVEIVSSIQKRKQKVIFRNVGEWNCPNTVGLGSQSTQTESHSSSFRNHPRMTAFWECRNPSPPHPGLFGSRLLCLWSCLQNHPHTTTSETSREYACIAWEEIQRIHPHDDDDDDDSQHPRTAPRIF